MKKWVMGLLTVIAMVTALLPGTVLATTGGYTDENHWLTIDGVKLEFDFDPENKTAMLWKLENPEQPTELNIPETVEYNDTVYTVDRISLNRVWSGSYSNITALTLPDTVEVIDANFNGLKAIRELTIPGSVKRFEGIFQGCTALEKLVFAEGVEEIASNSMVSNCANLREIYLPSTLKLISEPNTFGNAKSLESIELPEGVVISEGSTFSGCTALKSIELPESITKIGSDMFSGCTALESVTAKGTITEIGSSAFSGCTNLKTVPSLDEVNKIDSYAFKNCYVLSGSPDFSNLTEVGAYAFYNCYNLSGTLDLSGLSSIPNYAFKSYGSSISDTTSVELVLGSGLKSIGNSAFESAGIKGTLELPAGLESIGNKAFYKDEYISGPLNIPDSVTSMGDNAFGYTGVTDVCIGKGLEDISAGAFTGCSSLSSVTINAAADDVELTGKFPNNVAPVFTVTSIGDVGDTISDGGESIHDAVLKGGTVILEKDVKLTRELTIASGTQVVLTSNGPHTITTDANSGLKCLITIKEGASLRIEGDITLTGHYVDVQKYGALILCNGELELAGGIIKDTELDDGSAAVYVNGDGAKAVISGGSIEDNDTIGDYSGAVRVGGGAVLSMTGGAVRSNTASGSSTSSAGVLVFEGGTFEMTGGSIENNSGRRGSGVMLYSVDEDAPARFTMYGGDISGNISSGSTGTAKASGAVHVEGYAAFTMKGGKISGNSAVGGAGGGVCVVDPGVQNEYLDDYGTSFTMEGGEISGNTAGTGGGIYSYSNCVRLLAGQITGNSASKLGGGVYSEGNYDFYSTLYMENALITANSAIEQGGGLWLCPTGMGEIYVTDGAAIFGNGAGTSGGTQAAGDDVLISGDRTSEGHSLNLPDRLLGGGSVSWYIDGGTFPNSTGGATWPSVNTNVPRFDPEQPGEPVSVKDKYNIALKAVPGDGAEALAKSKAKLVISGNTANMGGGVGANGGVIIGDADGQTCSITIKKVWKDSAPGESVTVNVFSDGFEIDSAVLSSENNWTAVLTGLPADIGTISAKEVPVSGYDSSVEVTQTAGGWLVEVTNSRIVYPDVPGPGESGVPGALNGDDHYAYVIGYEDGTVRPEANISRAEVAAIFFRLLTDEAREANLRDYNSFTDVPKDAWYNIAVSTLAGMGILDGRTTYEFCPDAQITRAEFAAICARFDKGNADGASRFTDIAGHWAEAEIMRAEALGWIDGYPDGTFRPDRYITRAEAMTIINRVLQRLPEDETDLLPDMNVWPDNQPESWYYLAVQEATNSHYYTRHGIFETWLRMREDPDWDKYQ